VSFTTLRPPLQATDVDGKAILLVPLARTSLQAKIFPADYERLIAAGWSGNWVWNGGHVKVSHWRTNVTRVTRLIAGLSAGDRIQARHIDRDRLNLRSDNIQLKPMKPYQPHPQAA
jgi:hypothetical protein